MTIETGPFVVDSLTTGSSDPISTRRVRLPSWRRAPSQAAARQEKGACAADSTRTPDAKPSGTLRVNGPFRASHSLTFNGFGIFAYALP